MVVASTVPVTVMEVTGIAGAVCPLMVIVISPYLPEPSLAVAMTVTVPLDVAVSSPDALMDAPPVPDITVQVTDYRIFSPALISLPERNKLCNPPDMKYNVSNPFIL